MGGWRREVLGWRGLLAAVLLGMPAWAAQESTPEPQAETPPTGAAAVKQGKEEPQKKKGWLQPKDTLGEAPEREPAPVAEEEEEPVREVRVFGRVFARGRADERDEWARTLGIPTARVGLEARLGNVRAEVSADLSSRRPLRDAFVRLADDAKRLRLYAGQFKAPFLARVLDSSWSLPLVGRGLVEDYLVETHQLGGRRLGMMGEVRLKRAWDLKVSGGLFQGATGAADERLSEDAAVRARVRPFKALSVGTSAYLGEVLEGTRRHALAADASLRLGQLQLAAELVTGALALGPFDAQLARAHYTLQLDADWALQPTVGAELLTLRGALPGQGWAMLGGVNILFMDSFKAQLQAERALRPGDAAPGLEYSLQLATRF